MKRRAFVLLIGGAAVAWPFAARAQQLATPVIGYMNGGARDEYGALENADAVRQRLSETCYIEHWNITLEYRWAEGHDDRLPGLAADLVRQKVNVIAATGTPAALAAKATTAVIPIVFETAGDPVTLGLVASLNRPGRNVTGVTQLNSELVSKRLGLLHDLIPTAKIIGLLVNPKDPRAETQSRDMQEAAARALGLQIHIVSASTEAEIDTAFAGLVQLRAGALIVGWQLLRYAAGTTRGLGRTTQGACDLPVSLFRRGRRPDELWSQHHGRLSPRWHLHRPSPQGRKADRPAGRAPDQGRGGHQPQDRQRTRPEHFAGRACYCRRSDRIMRKVYTAFFETGFKYSAD